MPRAPWFFSCGRATAPPIIRSPVHLPRHLRPAPQVHSRPSSSISRSRSCTYCHAFLCSRHSVSGEPRVVQPFLLLAIRRKARRIRTPSGPAVPLHSLPAPRKAFPDPGRSSRSSSVTIRCQEGVSGISGGPAVHLTRYPPPGRRIRTPSGPAVHLYSPSAPRKAYPDRGWFRRSSSLAIRLQEGVSGPRLVQPFIFTRYPLPRRRIRTPSGPAVPLHSLPAARKAFPDPGRSSRSSSVTIRCQEGVSGISGGPAVHLHSLSAARKAYSDLEWSSRSSLLAIRRQEGVSGPRVIQAFIFTCYPPPGRCFRTATGPEVYRHSLSAARKAYRDPEWSSRSSSLAVRHRENFPDRDWSYRSSSLAIRRQEGAPRPRVVQPFIFSRYPPPGGRIRTPSGPAVHLHSLSAARKAYPDPEWSSRSSSLALRCQEGVSGPRVVQPFIFTRYPLPGRRIRTPSVRAVHFHSLSASRKAYPDPEWSRRSFSLAIRRQEGVPGPWIVQPFIFTRCPPPGRRIRTPSGPGVHPHSLSASRKAYREPEWSSHSSSLAVRCQEGVSGPWMVQPFIFTRCPPPGRRIRTPSGPAVHLHSLSAARKAYPDPEWSSRSSSLALRCQEGVSGPRVVQPFIFTRYPLPGRRIRTPSGRAVHFHSLSAARKAYPDPEWSRRSFSLAIRCQEGVSGARVVQAFIFTRYRLPGRRLRTPSGPGVQLHSLSAARKAYPDPEWSRRSSALAIRLQKGVSGPPVVQQFIFTRTPLPGRRTGTLDGPAVHLHSLSATGKAYADRDWSYRSSSLAIRRQECARRPRVVQPFIFTRYPLPGRRIRTATGPGDYLHSLSAAKKPHPDPEWSSRSSSLAIRHQEGVSGPRVVQAFIRTRYPPPERCIGNPSGPVVHLHSLSAAKNAYPVPEWSSRSSSLAIRCQERVSGPRVVQPFIFTRCPPPGRRIRTPSGPAVHLHSLSAARKAYPDRGWSSRTYSLALRCQEGVSGPWMVQPFIFTRCPLPGRPIQTRSGPGVYPHSPSAARKASPDPEWSRRSSSLAIRCQEGVSGPQVVQPFIFTPYPLPGRRIWTARGPAVHLYSLSAARKAYPDPEWSMRSSSPAVRCQEGVSRPRAVQAFILNRYPLPGRRIRTPSGRAVHFHSLSAARKAYPDPEWSRRSFSLAIRCQEGVSGARVVQAFIFTRYRLPGRRLRTPSGPGVQLHSLSAARKAYPEPEWSRHLSSLAIGCQEGVSGPRVVQAFNFTRYPLPGRRIRTPSGPGVHFHSLSAARKAYPDPEWSRRSFSLAIRCQEGVSGARVVQAFIFTRYRLPGRRLRTPSGPGVQLHSLSAARKAYPDPEWSRRSSALAIRLQKGVSGPPVVQQFIFTRTPLPGRRTGTLDGPAVHLHSLSATGKAYADRDWSYRSSSLAIRRQECARRPRVVQPFIFTRYPLPGRRIRTATGPGDYLHSLSAAKKPHPDPEWSSRSSSLAIRHQEGVSGPRVVQAFIRTRYPPPERCIGNPSGPVVHLHSLSAAKNAYPVPEWSSRSSSLAIRCQERVSGPRVVQPFIFTRCPPPGRRIRTPSGPAVHLHSLSAARKAYPDRGWSSRTYSLALRCQEGVSGPWMVQPFIFTRCPLPGRPIQTRSGPGVYPHSPSAARKASPDPEWSRRSSSLAIRCQEGVSGPQVVQPFIFTPYPLPGRRIWTARGPAVHLYSLSAARKAYPDPEWSMRSSSPAVRCQEGVSRPRAVQAFILNRYPLPGRRLRTPSGPAVHLHSLSAARKVVPGP